MADSTKDGNRKKNIQRLRPFDRSSSTQRAFFPYFLAVGPLAPPRAPLLPVLMLMFPKRVGSHAHTPHVRAGRTWYRAAAVGVAFTIFQHIVLLLKLRLYLLNSGQFPPFLVDNVFVDTQTFFMHSCRGLSRHELERLYSKLAPQENTPLTHRGLLKEVAALMGVLRRRRRSVQLY